MGFCETFSWGQIFSIHEGIWTLVMIHRPLALYYAEKIDGNNDLGRTREKNSRQADRSGKLSTHKGLGVGRHFVLHCETIVMVVDYLAHTSPHFHRFAD